MTENRNGTASGGLAVREFVPADVLRIAAMIKGLKLGFLSQMPDPIIALYYGNIELCRDFTCRVLTKGDDIMGFYVIIVGNAVPRYAPFLKTPARLLLLSSALVLPLFLFARYLILNLRTAAAQRSYRRRYDSELIYIGVKDSEEGKGLGTMLMKDMRQVLERKGASWLGLEYFKDDAKAARFYDKFDHEKLGEINTGGRISVSLRIPVGNLPA